MQQLTVMLLAASALFLLAGPAPARGASLLLDVAADHTCAPLDAVTATGEAPAGGRLAVSDGQGTVYAQQTVGGSFTAKFTVGGALGTNRVALLGADGAALAEATFKVDAKTGIRTNTGGYGAMWDQLQALIYGRGPRPRTIGGKPIRFYVSWLRDDTHVMKAYKYWEPQPGELQEHFLSIQTPEGIIYDYFTRAAANDERAQVFGPRYTRRDVAAGIGYDRLPVEADVEYLAVEAIYTCWQARGDNERMARQLPALERGLHYDMTDPLRWSEKFGLVKRGYTIDTWDFKFFGFDRSAIKTGNDVQENVFNIHPDTPMCIMHGDNSGMYQACRQMATMFAALSNTAKHDEYERLAEQFRTNLNKDCWNGHYYDHWVPVTPLNMDQGGIDGNKVLSLSNPYDINRGAPDQQQSASIIREYMGLRDKLKDEYFAEWVSAYPYWPKGFSGTAPGEYVNGGVLTIVAGELAKAAFQHGFEAYGTDIVDRIQALMAKQGGRLPCAYKPNGELTEGIPDNWGQAAVMSAMMEGLCGLRDDSVAFRDARIEPRWAAAGVTDATATARYGASTGYVAYRFEHDPAAGRIRITPVGSGSSFSFHVLLPQGASARSVTLAAKALEFRQSTVESSPYVDFDLKAPLGGTVEIAYGKAG